MSKHHVTATVNGDAVEFLCETQETLLDCLRDQLGLTGTKEGCSTGDCGACSVTVDGRLVCSCLMLGVEANGKSIGTIEGMAAGEELHPLQRKFIEHAALQCGICTPGFLVAAKALLEKHPDPERDGSALLAGRQSVPLHRLRQDRPRGARRRQRDERSLTMQEKVTRLAGLGVHLRRHPPRSSRRRRQGHGSRPVRRRSRHVRPAGRQGAAEPASARAHQVDRHQRGGEAAGRQGRHHRHGFQGAALRVHPGRRDDGQLQRRRAQRHGAREGALRGPCRRRGGRHQRRRGQAGA